MLQSQADTITCINLSGLGITDIRDVAYLPHVEVLNLSNNGITNTFPLIVLDSLQLLNLSSNELESIAPLVFSNAKKMIVLIAYNYISDFSYFLTPTNCQITLVGMSQQKEKNAPYFDVDHLYTDVDKEGNPMVSYRGFTNMDGEATLNCGWLSVSAVMDGTTNNVTLPKDLDTTTKVILSNGVRGDTTWIVPPMDYFVEKGGEVTIDLKLPESYRIGYLCARYGSMEVNGTMLHYVAPVPFRTDTLYLNYYESNRIKGFTQINFMAEDFYQQKIGDVNGDGVVNVSDVTAIINHILGKTPSVFSVDAADVNGDGKVNVSDVTATINIILGK